MPDAVDLTSVAPPEPGRDSTSGLKQLVELANTNKRVKRECDDHTSHSELLDSMIIPLEEQRRQLQEQVTAATYALITAGVPTKRKRDEETPFYYCSASHTSRQEVPWNEDKHRPMALAEGVEWVASQRAGVH